MMNSNLQFGSSSRRLQTQWILYKSIWFFLTNSLPKIFGAPASSSTFLGDFGLLGQRSNEANTFFFFPHQDFEITFTSRSPFPTTKVSTLLLFVCLVLEHPGQTAFIYSPNDFAMLSKATAHKHNCKLYRVQMSSSSSIDDHIIPLVTYSTYTSCRL